MIRAALLVFSFLIQPANAELASFYGNESGTATASGERFDENKLTAACCGPGYHGLPFGTRVRICRGDLCVVVRVNDRGPFVKGRYIDLSTAAAKALHMIEIGVAEVSVQVLKGD